MADLDKIAVCERCWIPARPLTLLCPRCGEKLRLDFPSLLLATMRTFRARGWVVSDWLMDERRATKGGEVKLLSVMFHRLAPPVTRDRLPKVVEEGIIRSLFSGYGNPGVMAEGRTELQAFRAMADFAESVPKLAMPFWSEICGKCDGQGGDWMFCECKCPASSGGWRRFADGIPEKCAYAVEQVMSREERLGIMLSLFEEWPISKRMLSRRV